MTHVAGGLCCLFVVAVLGVEYYVPGRETVFPAEHSVLYLRNFHQVVNVTSNKLVLRSE